MTDPDQVDLISHHIALARGDMRVSEHTAQKAVAAESQACAIAHSAIAQALALSRIEQHLALIAESLAFPTRTVTSERDPREVMSDAIDQLRAREATRP